MHYDVIDSDQHIIEPRDLWEQWLPKKFRDLINQMSLGVPEAEKRQIFCENAGRLYGFID